MCTIYRQGKINASILLLPVGVKCYNFTVILCWRRVYLMLHMQYFKPTKGFIFCLTLPHIPLPKQLNGPNAIEKQIQYITVHQTKWPLQRTSDSTALTRLPEQSIRGISLNNKLLLSNRLSAWCVGAFTQPSTPSSHLLDTLYINWPDFFLCHNNNYGHKRSPPNKKHTAGL